MSSFDAAKATTDNVANNLMSLWQLKNNFDDNFLKASSTQQLNKTVEKMINWGGNFYTSYKRKTH